MVSGITAFEMYDTACRLVGLVLFHRVGVPVGVEALRMFRCVASITAAFPSLVVVDRDEVVVRGQAVLMLGMFVVGFAVDVQERSSDAGFQQNGSQDQGAQDAMHDPSVWEHTFKINERTGRRIQACAILNSKAGTGRS